MGFIDIFGSSPESVGLSGLFNANFISLVTCGLFKVELYIMHEYYLGICPRLLNFVVTYGLCKVSTIRVKP